jgi:hypothetical protein
VASRLLSELFRSEHLTREIRVLGNVPQPIYKIPLKDIPDQGLTGIEIPALIDRVIMGPTQYPSASCGALIELLTAPGMKDACQRVAMSDIPLRR